MSIFAYKVLNLIKYLIVYNNSMYSTIYEYIHMDLLNINIPKQEHISID